MLDCGDKQHAACILKLSCCKAVNACNAAVIPHRLTPDKVPTVLLHGLKSRPERTTLPVTAAPLCAVPTVSSAITLGRDPHEYMHAEQPMPPASMTYLLCDAGYELRKDS